MKIYCARHGEALSSAVDSQRALSENGQADVQRIANHLQQCGVEINHVMHSPKLRAKQTANILADTLNILDRHELDTIVDAEADVTPFIEMINTWTEDTLVVGHLPFLHGLVCQLVNPDSSAFPIISYPPGGIVCLEYYEAQRWIIKWHLVPNIVPR